MKTTKVIYRATSGKTFKVIVPKSNEEEVLLWMRQHYLPQIQILSMRNSVKKKYSKVVNYTAK
jgi:hypothetical protein